MAKRRSYRTLQKQILMDAQIKLIGKSRTVKGQIKVRKQRLKTCIRKMEDRKNYSMLHPDYLLKMAKTHLEVLQVLWIMEARLYG